MPSTKAGAVRILVSCLLAHITIITPLAAAIDINVDDKTSVKAAASKIAKGLFTTYHNVASTAGDFNQPEPWFWWLSGSGWTGLLDYMIYTGDRAYKADLFAAYKENIGPGNDFAPLEQKNWEANDDQMYWLYGALTAMEYGFDALPCEKPCTNSWLAISINAVNAFARRWRADESTCGGGLKWQYRPSEPGYTYKNAVTNGGFFQSTARLARFTGNETYAVWADIIYDWSERVRLVTPDYHVVDGTSDHEGQNCSSVNRDEWSYNIATYMHGAANMYAYYALRRPGDKQALAKWKARTEGFVATAGKTFFSQGGAVMYEQKCERANMACSTDQTSFKSSLGRWMGKTAVLVPSVRATASRLLKSSARAAAGSCQDSSGKVVCGQRWTTGMFDGQADFGTYLSALEVVQSVLTVDAPPLLVQAKPRQGA
ncbi:glycoside hydrolase [Microdochium trichocladiopsis]|uniref:Mannan endo-1,6-alpha-mannosidase n=1 Tax=Microdochium trichocladiopsis TaxID=1682393 RepID=A0A9P9BK61_9PEZI|nr:glycoside hydrolase [Microdochium trichocladiopsis]KAH7026304.1 glycoside hydrolase [Microdochium trichocladiopsis]